MKLDELYKYFNEATLRDGFVLYKKGISLNSVKTGNLRSIKVEGYNVMYSEKNGDFSVACDCPEANFKKCKHIVAVLLTIKNNNKNKKPWAELIKSLKDFEEYYKQGESSIFSSHRTDKEKAKLYKDFLNDIISGMHRMSKENKMLVFKILMFLLEELNRLERFYKSYEEVFMEFDYIFEEVEVYTGLVEYIRENYRKYSQSYLMEKLIELTFLITKFRWQAEIYFRFLDEECKKKSKVLMHKVRLSLLYRFIDRELALKEVENYEMSEVVFDIMLEESKDDLDRYIKLISDRLVSEPLIFSMSYYEKLVDILYNMNAEKYEEIVCEFLKRYPSISIFKKLKRLYNEKDWCKVREKYLQCVEGNGKVYREICLEEKCYDRLVESLKCAELNELNRYKSVLKEYRPREGLTLYSIMLQNELDNMNITDEKKVFNTLKVMTEFEGGKEAILKIIDSCVKKYDYKEAFTRELEFFLIVYL